MILEKKPIWVIFLFKFKMGFKAAETTHNISNAFGPGTAHEHTMQCGSESFAKETRALKMRKVVANHQKSAVTNWEQSSKLILLKPCDKLPKNSITLWSFDIWSKLERWNSSTSVWPMSWPQIKKSLFWSVIFSYSEHQQTTAHSGSDGRGKVDFMWHERWLAQWLDQEEAPKHFPEPDLHQRKSRSLVVCQSDPL